MRKVSLLRSLPAPDDRPDFATWFGQMKKIDVDMSTHVYGRRLAAFYSLRVAGTPCRLVTIKNKSCMLIIERVELL